MIKIRNNKIRNKIFVMTVIFLLTVSIMASPAQSLSVDCSQSNSLDYGGCCCWTPDPTGGHAWGHVMDLGIIVDNESVNFEIKPGAGDADCKTTGYMYYSPDGSAWTSFWSDFNLAGWTTYSDSAYIADSFRYIRANTDQCSVDWSYVSVGTTTNQPPIASFKSLNVHELGQADEETLDGGHMVGGVIRFDPTSSYDPDGDIIKYEWDFDNGVKFSTNEPNIYDITFKEARIYNVVLIVTDNDGSTNTFTETIDLSLKVGDLIFIRTAWWDIPFNIANNEYTHVGMYIGDQLMVETILSENSRSNGQSGVVVTPISEWSYPTETYATLVRVETADDKIRQEAKEFALSKLGQEYDLKVLKKSVNSPNYYCSELIWAAYSKASKGKIDLGNKGKKGGVWPDDIITDIVNIKTIGYHHERNPK